MATLLFSQQDAVSRIDPSAKLLSPIGTISTPQGNQEARDRLLDRYDTLPLNFEINHGQTDARVKFLMRTGGSSLSVTGDEAVLALRGKKSKRGISQEQKATSWGISTVALQRRSGNILKAGPFSSGVRDPSSGRDDAAAEPMTS